MDAIDLLGRLTIFAGLDRAALEQLAGAIRHRTVPPQETIFREGDPAFALYVVVSGGVFIQKATATGRVLYLNRLGPGEAFGQMALVTGRPRSADAVTAEATSLLMLERDAFVRCVEATPRIALNVMAYLADLVRHGDERSERLQSLDILGRVSALLMSEMRCNSTEVPGGRRLGRELSLQFLADAAATTRESACRVLGRMRRLGLIRMEGRRIVVLDEGRLRRQAAPAGEASGGVR